MSTLPGFHEEFDKFFGGLRLRSFGGSSPRYVRLCRTDRHGEPEIGMTVEEAHDLHYILGRFLAAHPKG